MRSFDEGSAPPRHDQVLVDGRKPPWGIVGNLPHQMKPRLGHTNLMFCFASTAGQFSGKVNVNLWVWLWCHEIASFPDLRVRDESRAIYYACACVSQHGYPYPYPSVDQCRSDPHLGTGTGIAISINTCTHAVSHVTGLVPRRTRKSGNETMFTNIIRPPGSLPQAVPLVKQNIKLVWPYWCSICHILRIIFFSSDSRNYLLG